MDVRAVFGDVSKASCETRLRFVSLKSFWFSVAALARVLLGAFLKGSFVSCCDSERSDCDLGGVHKDRNAFAENIFRVLYFSISCKEQTLHLAHNFSLLSKRSNQMTTSES